MGEGLSSLHKCTHNTRQAEKPGVKVWTRGNLAVVNRSMVKKECERCGATFRVPEWCLERYRLCKACLSEVVIIGGIWYEKKRREKKRQVVCRGCGETVNVMSVIVGKTVDENGDVVVDRRADPEECPHCSFPLTLGNRGEITRFSEHSRRRLMRMLATIDRDIRPVFVTLTYPDSAYEEVYGNPERWKMNLRAFVERFRRRFSNSGCLVWRLEVVDRKSGEHVGQVFPHFHLLVFGVPFSELRSFVPVAWFEVVGTGDEKHLHAGTQVKPVLSRRGIFRYASKTVGNVMSRELGKAVQASGNSVGRWWGVELRENFTAYLSPAEDIELEEGESIKVLRTFRKFSKVFGRAFSRLTTFIDGQWLLKNLSRLAVPVMTLKSFRATGRRFDIPFWRFAYDTGLLVPQLE